MINLLLFESMMEYLEYYKIKFYNIPMSNKSDKYIIEEFQPCCDEDCKVYLKDTVNINCKIFVRISFGEDDLCYLLKCSIQETLYMVYKGDNVSRTALRYFETEEDAKEFIKELGI